MQGSPSPNQASTDTTESDLAHGLLRNAHVAEAAVSIREMFWVAALMRVATWRRRSA